MKDSINYTLLILTALLCLSDLQALSPVSVNYLLPLIEIRNIFNHYLPKTDPDIYPEQHKRRLHCLQVNLMHDAFSNQRFQEIVDKIPAEVRNHMTEEDRKQYIELLNKVFSRFYKQLSLKNRLALKTATHLHDIGYFSGPNWQHNVRGAELALKELSALNFDPEISDTVYQLILRHGDITDIGVDSFPEDITDLNPQLKAGVFLITLFDCMGKPAGNLLSLDKLKMIYNTESFLKKELLKNDFLSFRLKNIFSPTVFVRQGEWDKLALDTRNLIRSSLPAKVSAKIISLWNSKLAINIFPLFQAAAKKSPLILAKLLTALAINIPDNLSNRINIEADIDFMALDNKDRDVYLKLLFNRLDKYKLKDASLPLTYSGNNLIINFRELLPLAKNITDNKA